LLATRAHLQFVAKVSGAQFDREFAKAMVQDHQNDIREFEK
jgi:hypothetical protein